MLPMVASFGFQYAGMKAGTQGIVTGAESQAKIEKMSRDYQNRVFKEGYKQQEPFMKAGVEALPLYQRAVSGDAQETGIGAMERRMVEKETSSMSDHVRNVTAQKMEAEGAEKTKGRLMDIMQIGLGQSGAAGRSAINLGSSLAGSLQRGGSALASATMAGNIGRQNMYMGALEQLSGLPAYMAMRPSTPQPPARVGYVGGVQPQPSGGIMYA